MKHEILKNEVDQVHQTSELVSSPKKGPAPPPPSSTTATTTTMASVTETEILPLSTTDTIDLESPITVEPIIKARVLSQSMADEPHYSTVDRISENYSSDHRSRRSLNRQNYQRHGSADVLCQHSNNHEYMNRSSTSSSSFYPTDNVLSSQLNYYDYDQSRNYIQQIEEELKQTKEQLNATMKSIKTFWSPELKKERSLRKEESCRYQLLINEHQKRTKQVTFLCSFVFLL